MLKTTIETRTETDFGRSQRSYKTGHRVFVWSADGRQLDSRFFFDRNEAEEWAASWIVVAKPVAPVASMWCDGVSSTYSDS